jgi:hypothetical protein
MSERAGHGGVVGDGGVSHASSYANTAIVVYLMKQNPSNQVSTRVSILLLLRITVHARAGSGVRDRGAPR